MKKIIITAGGTSEPIDRVRKITNSSSGKLGMVIANELLTMAESDIDTIYYVCSKSSLRPNSDKVKVVEIESTKDLKETVERLLTTEHIDYFIHSMAVSDYTTAYVTNSDLLSRTVKNVVEHLNDGKDLAMENATIVSGKKISSNEDNLLIMLKPTPKIISLIKELSPETFLVGFKLLDNVSEEELIKVATKLRDKNHCDLVVANDLNNIRQGNHKAFIIDQAGEALIANGKEDIAKKLVRKMYHV